MALLCMVAELVQTTELRRSLVWPLDTELPLNARLNTQTSWTTARKPFLVSGITPMKSSYSKLSLNLQQAA